jgi:PAS domain S-box-containing protein
MRAPEKNGEKPIEQVENKRSQKVKLERVSRDTAKPGRTEQIPSQANDLYQAMMENAHLLFALIDKNYKILMVNKAVCKNFRKPAGELIGRKCFQEFEKRDAVCPYCPGTQAMATGRPEEVETEKVRDNGSRFPVCIQAFPNFDSNGAVTGFIEIVQDITERKKAEEKLKQYQFIVESARDAIFFKNLESRYIIANDSTLEVFGLPHQKVIGKDDYEVLANEAEAKKNIEDDKIVFKTGKPIEITKLMTGADGKQCWFQAIKVPQFDDKGRVIGLVGIARDITERKNMEEQIEKLARFPEENSSPVYRVSKDGVLLYANPASREQILEDQTKIGDKIPEKWIGMIKNVYDSGTRQEVEVELNGRIFLFEQVPIIEGGYVNSYAIDITERKKAEEALRLSEEKFAKAFSTSPAAIFITTLKEGRFIDLNEIAIGVFGYTREEVVGHTAKELNMWANYNDRDIVVQNIRRGNAVRDMDARFCRKSGEVFDGIISVDVINIGSTECLISTIVDITERKNMEEALRRNEARYRSSIELTGQLAWTTDSNGEVVEDIPLWRKFTGLSYEETKGSGWTKALHPEDAEHTRQVWGKAVKDKKAYEVEYRLRRFDGVYRDFLTRGIPVFKEDGSIREWVGVNIDITDRKKAEEKLHFTRFTIDNAVDTMVCVDQDARNIDVNDAFCRAVGYSREELLSMTVHDIDPNYSAKIWPEFWEKLKQKGSLTFESCHRRKDGKVFPIEATVTFFKYKGKEYHCGFARDITERKKASKALAQSESKFRSLVEHLPQKIFIKDKNSVYLFSNQNYARDMKITPEEIIGKTDYDFYPKELAEKYRSDDKRIIKTGKIEDIEEKYIENGEDRWVHTIKTPYKDAKGNIIGMLGIFRDITEYKKNQNALKAEQKRLYDVLETMPVMVCLLTPDYHVSFANRSFREKFGEANGRRCYEYCFGRSEPCDFCQTYNVLKTGKPHHWEITSPDGRSIIDAYDFPFTDTDGSPLILEMDIDITERKKAEQKMREGQQQLRSLASELTLVEERERARLAAEMHDESIQSVSISKMKLDELRKSVSNEGLGKKLEEICDLLDKTIKDMRSLIFKVSSPVFEQFGFELAVQDWLFEQVEKKHNIKTEYVTDQQVKSLDKNVALLLFRNVRELLTNIIKHAKGTKIKISVNKVGNDIKVCVEDNGIGFDIVNVLNKAVSEGAFGLFSIRQCLENLNGRLEIKSEPGCGCSITMIAPLNG